MPAFLLFSHPCGRLCSGLFHGCTIVGNATVPLRFSLPSPADLHVKFRAALLPLPGHLLSNRLEPLAPQHFPCSRVTPPLRLGSNQQLGRAALFELSSTLPCEQCLNISPGEKISPDHKKGPLRRTACAVLRTVSNENRMLSHTGQSVETCASRGRISPQTLDLSAHLFKRKNSNRKGLEEDLEHHLEKRSKSICQSAYSL